MTLNELRAWQHEWETGDQSFSRDGVQIYPYRGGSENKPVFRVFTYKKMRGVLHADNGYLGPQPDGRDYYPLVCVAPSLSQESRFNPCVSPDMETIAAAIINVWNDFIA